MSFFTSLFRTNSAASQNQPAAGVSLQSSIYGRAIAIIYGTVKTAGNVILYGNFNAQSQSQGGGGKGNMFGGGGSAGGSQFL